MVRKKKIDWDALNKVRFHEDGLSSYHGKPDMMPTPHRHNEVEFNFLDSGSMTYVFGGGQITVNSGQLHVFWAGPPHQVVRIAPGTQNLWVTVPLNVCMQWKLPVRFFHQLLFSKILFETNPNQGLVDRAIMHQWHRDLKSGNPERRNIVLLEMEARMRRLALGLGEGAVEQKGSDPDLGPRSESGIQKVGQMTAYMSENYTRPVKVTEIAASVNLRPNYAMRLFRNTFGTSLIDYVTQLRVMHAQRLLTLSDAKVIDIALESGFKSLSNFYSIFEQVCRQSPGDYRKSLLKPGSSK